MHAARITFRSSSIHYLYAGTGPEVVICFHGYGESAHSFECLQKQLSPEVYTIIAIDLPFHGDTYWKEGSPFQVTDLAAILQDIGQTRFPGRSPFILIGYSMGGRVALSLCQQIPGQIKKVILLAPDGLKLNFWYWLATQSRAGNRLFHFTMEHPRWFTWILQLGNRLGLINQSIFKFTRQYIHDRAVRRQLYNRWMGMRRFRPSLPLIKAHIRAHRLAVHLVYGQYDRIIRHETGEKFRKGMEEACFLHILPTGHQVLQEKNAALIKEILES